jgi:hypothetical protein
MADPILIQLNAVESNELKQDADFNGVRDDKTTTWPEALKSSRSSPN